MDVVVGFPATCERWWIDVTVRSPWNISVTSAGKVLGAAASGGDRDKRIRYGDRVHCISIEVGGRISSSGLRSLAALCAASRDYGRKTVSGQARGTTPRKLATRLCTLVSIWSAEATLQSLGL